MYSCYTIFVNRLDFVQIKQMKGCILMKASKVALLAITLLSTVSVASLVSADSLTSSGDVTFTKPTDVVNPVDPGDGDKGTGSAGDLVISEIPNLTFGTHDITGTSGIYDLARSNQLQVADRRGVASDGKAQGWTVTVAATEFVNGTDKLAGAALKFNSGSVKALTGETGTAPKVVANTVDSTKGATPVFAASADQGLGQWGATFSDKDVQLSVPVQQAGAFTSTLTWAITNSPSA